ncbi:MAG: GNAT family N-acetyltransferase [Cyclobacteriaceae bacterium]|nr:GNAT family N-acetyltransferase [Cyclobacteriaceae bacterium]MCH8515268.1 GNAT family N-acetyltransferase [Cyclobacteriaceae bacterium]
MIIRKASIEDSKNIAYYLMMAMDEIVYQFIGLASRDKAIQFLESLIILKNNQYSYENCWMVEIKNQIVGAALIYDGGELHKLRKPVTMAIKNKFNRDFVPEDETQAGEFYIDCVAIHPNQQGKGLGTKIFDFLINEYVKERKNTLGLLVDKKNPKAKALYLRLGFRLVGEKVLVGKPMEHLQLAP